MLGFAMVGAHPPLYLAIPLQALGVWRATAADFCRSEVRARGRGAQQQALASNRRGTQDPRRPTLPLAAAGAEAP